VQVGERARNVDGERDAEAPREGERAVEDVLAEVAAREELADDEDARAVGERRVGRRRSTATAGGA